ncbi:hypothetical protein [Thermohalobacter berrensis]|uniref:Uncharacterized protein n=1 Tax=Thermohalobacter berrensis TaxID=99594 RepID=A0A419T9Q5_9FIRM|nr:hypothetical protein [Thermohalobacter berrensis]RKD34195.1 hypothetical protein BET03_07855 [Thermohalobacter berrensis]
MESKNVNGYLLHNSKSALQNLNENVKEKEREIEELRLLYKEKKIPYRLLDERIEEIFDQIKEDIKEELCNN